MKRATVQTQWVAMAASALTLAFALLLAVQARAQPAESAEELFDSKACFACHSVKRSEVKKLGPYLVDVAAKYRAQPDVARQLGTKVRTGGGGVWGDPKTSVMPPNNVTPEEAALLVAWVLQQQ